MGGQDNRKFMSKRFRDLLLDTHKCSMEDQNKKIQLALQDWMNTGREGQIDDILVMGFRV